MPAYDFRCPACDHVFEIVRAVRDSSAVSCPLCGIDAKRIFTPVGVVFKGSGFHNTDYRTKPSEPTADTPAESPAPCGKDTPSSNSCAGCPAADS